MPANYLAMADHVSFLLRGPTNRFSFFVPGFPSCLSSRRLKYRFSALSRSFPLLCASTSRRHGNVPVSLANAAESFCNTVKSRSGCLHQRGAEVDAAENGEAVISDFRMMEQECRRPLDILAASLFGLPLLMSFADDANAESNGGVHMIYSEIGVALESGVQLLYLGALLGLVGIASFFVVRQILIRRELESAAKILQERVRTGEALPVEYFELGAVMLRKRFFGLAAKYLEQAIDKWDGDPQDLAQVHNALGFSFFSDDKIDKAIVEYEKAVKLQPGYVVAWNNLGNAYQKKKDLPKALKAYEQALFFDPNNRVARDYRDTLKERVDRLAGVSIKSD